MDRVQLSIIIYLLVGCLCAFGLRKDIPQYTWVHVVVGIFFGPVVLVTKSLGKFWAWIK